MDTNDLSALCIAGAKRALNQRNPEAAEDWLEALEGAPPPDLVARCADLKSHVAASALDWPTALAEARRARTIAPTPWRELRLALLRDRRDLLTAAEIATIAATTPPPARLAPAALAPDLDNVWACGQFHSRGAQSGSPWSRYLRLSKRPIEDDADREAVFKLAAGYLVQVAQQRTHLLATAEVVVPIPANPDRYSIRGASLPDELASGCQIGLALHNLPFALSWNPAATQIEMKHLSNAERRQVASSLFVPGRQSDAVRDRNVLLVDDVTTSGSTLRAAAVSLRARGAKTVQALALAHTEG